jgi:hypothetical protein
MLHRNGIIISINDISDKLTKIKLHSLFRKILDQDKPGGWIIKNPQDVKFTNTEI